MMGKQSGQIQMVILDIDFIFPRHPIILTLKENLSIQLF